VFQQFGVGRGAAFGDIDNDGDVDVVISTIQAPARLLINTIGNRKHWVGLRLVGTPARRDMPGARVEVIRTNAPTLWRRARPDGSYASANDPRVLAGLGDDTDRPDVRVHWPDARVEEWAGVPIDTWTVLRQGEGVAR
jgi:hypothetical protein